VAIDPEAAGRAEGTGPGEAGAAVRAGLGEGGSLGRFVLAGAMVLEASATDTEATPVETA
jgi:hypothetical protein